MTIENNEERKILQNQAFVGHVINQMGIYLNSTEYKDWVQVGTIGLIKAVRTFDETKGSKFLVYAKVCIRNELRMHYKKEKRNLCDISLDMPMEVRENYNEVNLHGITKYDTENVIDFEDRVEQQSDLELCVNIILNILDSKEKCIMLYQMAGLSQQQTAKKLNISQAYISKRGKIIRNKVKEYFVDEKQFERRYSFKIVNKLYKITFYAEDIKNSYKIFEIISNELSKISKSSVCLSDREKKRIILEMKGNPKVFSFIANIIKKIEIENT